MAGITQTMGSGAGGLLMGSDQAMELQMVSVQEMELPMALDQTRDSQITFSKTNNKKMEQKK